MTKEEKEAVKDIELALNTMKHALYDYARAYATIIGSPIGNDAVIGESWVKIASGLIGLLNSEHGRIDAGEFCSHIYEIADDVGFSEQEINEI